MKITSSYCPHGKHLWMYSCFAILYFSIHCTLDIFYCMLTLQPMESIVLCNNLGIKPPAWFAAPCSFLVHFFFHAEWMTTGTRYLWDTKSATRVGMCNCREEAVSTYSQWCANSEEVVILCSLIIHICENVFIVEIVRYIAYKQLFHISLVNLKRTK